MTGREHYRAAEALIDLAEAEPEASSLTPEYLAAAQVHAMLAAATALTEIGDQLDAGLRSQNFKARS